MKTEPTVSAMAAGIAIVITFIVGATAGSAVTRMFHGEPSVVVNMPEGASPLETLKPIPESKVIPSDRAVLWWTVYDRTIKAWGPGDSIRAADRAVEAAYGPVKP